MKRVLNAPLLAAVFALPLSAGAVFAETGMPAFVETAAAGDMRASELIGKRLYTVETEIDASAPVAEASTDWNDIGEVNDVMISADGSVEAILIDIGGFLGIGEKTVAVPLSSLAHVPDADDPDDYYLVLTADRAVLENAPSYMSEEDHAAATETMPAATAEETAQSGATNSGEPSAIGDGAAVPDMTADANATAPAATGPMEGYVAVETAQLTSEQLVGTEVYDATETHIGEVGELVVSADGMPSEAIIDVGGFLGLGEKPVAVPLADLTVARAAEGEDLRIFVAMTKEQLEAMPEYEG